MARRKKQNNLLLGFLLLLLVVVIGAMVLLPGEEAQTEPVNEIDQTTLVKAGAEAPDFTVEMLDGSSVSLASLRGKVVLVNFWATWCPPCRQELTRVQKDLIDRFAGKEFCFLPISRGEERSVVTDFMEAQGYTFPVGLDTDQSIYNRFASNYIPRNFLVDKEGKVIVATVGYEPEEFDTLLETIAKNLE